MEKMELSDSDSLSRMPTTKPSCAVVVASFRPGPSIDCCVRSLLAQVGELSPEIIVVDSSRDGTAARLRTSFPTITVIELSQQTPQAAARNIGVARSQAQYVAFTDQDCVVPQDWLLRFLSWHGQGNYAAVGGAIGNGTPESAVGTASYLIEFNEFLPMGQPVLAEMIPHCNICFRREVFKTVGPFIEAPAGAEDLLYNFLVRQQGGYLLFDPSLVVTHLNRTDLSAFLHHQRELGFGSAIARRTAKLKGRPFVRYPLLAYSLPLVRLVRTLSRLCVRNRPAFRRYLQLLPLLIPGYFRWTAGFLAALDANVPLPQLNSRIAASWSSNVIGAAQQEAHSS